MTERKPLSKKIRFDVFKRDGFVCQYCGAHPPDALLEPDHITPVCEGGTNDIGNLVTACFNCNRGKAGNLLTVVPKSLIEQGAEVKEREDQIAGYSAIMEARRERIEDDMWRVADTLIPESSKNGMVRDRLISIKQFMEKLGLHDTLDAAEIAIARKPYSESVRWKYFCGVCWTKIRNGQPK